MGTGTRSGMLTDALARQICGPIIEAADAAGVGISLSVVEKDGVRRLFVSEVAGQILGTPAEELIGSLTFSSFAPDEMARMRQMNERWLRGEDVPRFVESTVIRRDGSSLPVECTFSSVKIEGKPATVSLFRDISERKRDEEALKRSESLFRKLIEAAPEAVAVSRDDRLVYGNPRLVALLGYDTLEELAERSIQLIHPDDRVGLSDRRKQLRDPTAEDERREYRMLRKDGGVVYVECSSLAIDFEGAPAFLTFVRDVTKRREAQTQLIENDRMAAVGRIAAAVAHELNNPLAYVMLNLGIFETELQRIAPDYAQIQDVRDRLRILREGTTHMAAVIQDLRGFCRPDASPKPVDVRKVLDLAISMAGCELPKHARLIREYAVVGPVLADGARLGQVFLNLLLNAAQALEPSDDAKESTIRIVVEPHGAHHLKVDVIDSGHGVPPQLVGRIFEPFFTTKAAGIGTGLGLPISRSIIEGLKGELTVERTSDCGSTFRVLLPTIDK